VIFIFILSALLAAWVGFVIKRLRFPDHRLGTRGPGTGRKLDDFRRDLLLPCVPLRRLQGGELPFRLFRSRPTFRVRPADGARQEQ
jgi:hypothetical protein